MRFLREKLARFMMGRYGADVLYYVLVLGSLALVIVNSIIVRVAPSAITAIAIISLIENVMFFYAIFRFLSRNIYKRQRENQAFLNFVQKPKKRINLIKCKIRDRKTHVYKRCPSCKNNLRLPKQKGKHTVVCPCCRGRFDVKI